MVAAGSEHPSDARRFVTRNPGTRRAGESNRALDALQVITVASTTLPAITWLLDRAPERAWAIAALALLHVAVSLRTFEAALRDSRRTVLYFTVQLAVLVGVLVLGKNFGGLPIVGMPLVVQASMALGLPRAWWVAGGWLLAIAGTSLAGHGDLGLLLLYEMPAYSAAVLFCVVFARLAQRAQDARAEAERLHAELQHATAAREQLAAEQERLRLARDIHDGLGHTLTAASMQLQAARGLITQDPDRGARMLDTAIGLVRDGLGDLRSAVTQMREDAAPSDLAAALAELATRMDGSGCALELHLDGPLDELQPAHRQATLRVVQEGLSNLLRHAAASRATLQVVVTEQRLRITLDDDGRGRSDAAPSDRHSHGLVGLRERARQLDGRFDSGPSADLGGFRIDFEVPR